jgi:hypothetical protein
MLFHTRQWVTRTVPAAALGLALIGSVTACSSSGNSSGSGPSSSAATESTSQICTDLSNQTKTLTSTLLGSLSGLTASASTDPSAAASQALATAKTALQQLVGVLRSDASKASDSGLQKALNESADELNTAVNNLQSVNDLQSLGTNLQSMQSLAKYCPGVLTE